MEPRSGEDRDMALLTLRAKLTVKKVKVPGVVQVFQQSFSWQPNDKAAAEAIVHPAAALTGTRCASPQTVRTTRCH